MLSFNARSDSSHRGQLSNAEVDEYTGDYDNCVSPEEAAGSAIDKREDKISELPASDMAD